ncbi:hypothetical protein PAXRUDRAFT_147029, partial [Paxillus rubicundulus Ve08.2h10]
NFSWMKSLDRLFTNHYVIISWPPRVPAIGPGFHHNQLQVDQMNVLTVPTLKQVMGHHFTNNASKTKNKKGKEVELVPIPEEEFCLVPWSEGAQQCHHFYMRAVSIPLVTATDGTILKMLSDSAEFIKTLPEGTMLPDRPPSVTPTEPPHTVQLPACGGVVNPTSGHA